MKLSTLLLFAAASACLAQTPGSTSQKNDKSAFTVQLPAQDTTELQKLPPAAVRSMTQMLASDLAARVGQQGCPVVLTSASLTPRLMLVRDGEKPGGGLDLGFRNASGKPIWSMQLSVEILVKKSVYDLAASSTTLQMTVYGSRSADGTFDESRHLALPQGIHPAIVSSVTLQQILYEDGTVWSAKSDRSCGFSPNGEAQIAAR